MSSFSALLSSIGGNKAPANPSQPPTPKPATAATAGARPNAPTNGTKLATPNGAQPLKRKADDGNPGPPAKLVKTEQIITTSRFQSTPRAAAVSPAVKPASSSVPYRGTSRLGAASSPISTAPKSIPKNTGSAKATPTPPPAKNGAPASSAKPRGFSAILQKAQAAQEAAKASGPSIIKHKPVEKLSKKERLKQHMEAVEKKKAEARTGKSGAPQIGRSRSGTPMEGKGGLAKKPAGQDTGYKGTMRKPAQPLGYSGTMRPGQAAPADPRKNKSKDLGQDKYGGYASWSDLDEAVDEEEGDYGSDSDMEGGFDDLEEEELRSARVAKKEDQEALAEEERLKQEKLERKKKLMAMNQNAAAKRRF